MHPTPDNDAWVTRLRNGDDEAFRALYDQYHQAVFANICRLVQRPVDAEDILQEVFLSLWASRHQLNPRHSVGGWLFTTSYYKASAFLKKSLKERLIALPDSAGGVSDIDRESLLLEEDRMIALHAAIELLPPRKRNAFRLCRLEGKTYEEAAEEMGLSRESIKDYVKSASGLVKEYVLQTHPALSGLSLCLITLYLRG